MITDESYARVLEAQSAEYKLELVKRDMQLIKYREALIAHGIEPPDADGEELLQMWQECRHVISTASQFVMKLGTQKELLVDWNKE